jgi:AAA15 family ATPase/GTPase
MRIRELKVNNYRCFEGISMKDISDLVILIGENDAGKSFLLEAVRLLGEKKNMSYLNIEGYEYLCFGAEPSADQPIKINADLNLNREDRKALQKSSLSSFVSRGDLSISLEVGINNGFSFYWKTIEGEGLPPLFGSKEATYPKFANSKEVFTDKSGKNINSASVTQTIERLLHSKIKFIPAVRDRPAKSEDFFKRDPFIPESTEEIIKSNASETVPARQREWNRYNKDKEQFVKGSMRLVGKDLVFDKNIKEGMVPIPPYLKGSGEQMILHLLHEIENTSSADIVLIEEPENHLHPRLIKKLMKRIKEISEKQKKQFFITTHSPFVIDSGLLSDVWFIWQEEGRTKITRVADKEELGSKFFQMGITPGDFLLSNFILIVEGLSDSIFLQGVAGKLGKSFGEEGITIIDAGGDSKEEPNYQLWVEVCQNVPLPVRLLLDGSSSKLKKKLIKNGIKEEDIKIWERGDIEDFYPRRLIVEFVKQRKGKELREEDVPKGQTVEKLNGILEKKWWKEQLARKVAEEITPEEIDSEKELKEFIEQIFKEIKVL